MSITSSELYQCSGLVSSIQANKKAVFSKYLQNADFAISTDAKTSTIDKNAKYLAFPFFVNYSNVILGIYSEGEEHASSDRQMMVKSTDGGLTYTKTVFFENSTGAYDFSLFEGVIPDGGYTILKTFTITNNAGVFSATQTSFVNFDGDNFALWSAISRTGGIDYRTGYANDRVALFQSTDNGITWTGKSIIMEGAGQMVSEAGIVYKGSSDFVVIVRSSLQDNNRLYQVESGNKGVSWGTPTLLNSEINGTQPNLVLLPSGNLLLSVGDRSGSSGVSGGKSSYFNNNTGVNFYISIDGGASWNSPVKVDGTYSIDGGQPCTIKHPDGGDRVYIPYYARNDVSTNPNIYSVTLTTTNL